MAASRVIWLASLELVALHAIGCAPTIPTSTRITYVDATDGPSGNTRLAIGEEFTAQGSPLIGDDNLWSKRREGNGGSVYTTNDGRPSGPEDGPQLMTTITGLAPGTRHRVYACFWSDHNNWQLKASLVPIEPPGDDPAVSFSKNGTPAGQTARTANAADFTNAVIVTESNRQMLQADLGTEVANANGEIAVYIDDFPNAGHSNRTWYDGVGVVPLPSSAISNRSVLFAFVIAAIIAAILYVAVSLIRSRRTPNDAESPIIPT